jgi:pimeloyl-ACP methyl ester carboxylesterase
LNKPYVLGHSFGGHIAVVFASTHGDMLSGLLLTDPAGILPTLGSAGTYWAIYFRTCAIQTMLRCSGVVGKWVTFTWFDVMQSQLSSYYWFEVC